jgi:hypothetical protein
MHLNAGSGVALDSVQMHVYDVGIRGRFCASFVDSNLEGLPSHRFDVSDGLAVLLLHAVDLQRLSVDRYVAVDALETRKGPARDEGVSATTTEWEECALLTDGASHLVDSSQQQQAVAEVEAEETTAMEGGESHQRRGERSRGDALGALEGFSRVARVLRESCTVEQPSKRVHNTSNSLLPPRESLVSSVSHPHDSLLACFTTPDSLHRLSNMRMLTACSSTRWSSRWGSMLRDDRRGRRRDRENCGMRGKRCMSLYRVLRRTTDLPGVASCRFGGFPSTRLVFACVKGRTQHPKSSSTHRTSPRRPLRWMGRHLLALPHLPSPCPPSSSFLTHPPLLLGVTDVLATTVPPARSSRCCPVGGDTVAPLSTSKICFSHAVKSRLDHSRSTYHT